MAKIIFRGLYSEKVFDIFKVLRGYANLKDLAKISKPFNFEQGTTSQGYQREIDVKHAEEIKKYFESLKGNKFIPEIILGLRQNESDQTVVIQDSGELREVSVDLDLLASNPGIIRRIDGNHRLHLANDLVEDPTRPNQYLVPFSLILLGPTTYTHDDVAEALIFHTINFKGKPLASEHGLNVILTTEKDRQKLFNEDPKIFATQYASDLFKQWPGDVLAIFGEEKLTNILRTLEMIAEEGILTFDNKDILEKRIVEVFDKVYQVFMWAKTENLEIAKHFEIIPAIALVLQQISNLENAKIDEVKKWLKSYNEWLVSNKLLGNFEKTKPAELWSIFKQWKENQPKNIFVACSFSSSEKMQAVRDMIKEAIETVKKSYPDINIKQIRMDEYFGESFVLTPKIFEDIDDSDFMIADLTEEKQNVYCEVGYARGKNKPFILTYRPIDQADGEKKNKVHADLQPFKYIQYAEVSQLRDKLIEEIKGIYGK